MRELRFIFYPFSVSLPLAEAEITRPLALYLVQSLTRVVIYLLTCGVLTTEI